jgi:hypothetical protein
MSVNAVTGHGLIVSRQISGTFVDIAELGDITLPELSRNEFDATTQNEDIDSYVLGVLRRSALTFGVNFIPSNTGHNEATGCIADIRTNVMRGYKFTHTSTSWVWIASGQVQKVSIKAPVDGKLGGDITLRFSGAMSINAVTFS